MSENDYKDPTAIKVEPSGAENEPIFNIPNIILFALLVLVGIHVGRETLLSEQSDIGWLLQTAFIPQRYIMDAGEQGMAYYTSALTYSFLHGDYMHLAINSLWLVAFGSVIAKRWGAVRFCLFWLASAIASALLFLVFNWGQVAFMVGASGVISALMGAATRFAFPKGGRFIRDKAHFLPRQTILETFENRTVVSYLVIWFGINLIPLVLSGTGSAMSSIAWEAHIGGFLFGFLGFALFDHKDWR